MIICKDQRLQLIFLGEKIKTEKEKAKQDMVLKGDTTIEVATHMLPYNIIPSVTGRQVT